MTFVRDHIIGLTEQLYPTGRAFRMAPNSWRLALHSGLADSEEMAYNDTVAIMDSMIPDNDRFSPADATDWERRLGLPTNSSTPLADRDAAILRKMSYPGKNAAKSHYLYFQKQLQDAGFNLYVFENTSGQNPGLSNANILSDLQYNNFQYGGRRYGKFINYKVSNSIYNNVDVNFDLGSDLKCTFFIGGNPLGTYVNVPVSREIELRQQILRWKPIQTTAILYINLV